MAGGFTYVKKGYDPGEVEQYIRSLEGEVKNYKDKEAAITQSIVHAQMAANDIVKNAKNQGRLVKENILNQLGDLNVCIANQRQMLLDFVKDYNNMVHRYLRLVDDADFVALGAKIDLIEKYFQSFKDDIEHDLDIPLAATNKNSNANAKNKGAPQTKNPTVGELVHGLNNDES